MRQENKASCSALENGKADTIYEASSYAIPAVNTGKKNGVVVAYKKCSERMVLQRPRLLAINITCLIDIFVLLWMSHLVQTLRHFRALIDLKL